MRHSPKLPAGDSAHWLQRTGKPLITYLILALLAVFNLFLIFIAKPAIGTFLWIFGLLLGIYSFVVLCTAVFIIFIILSDLPDDKQQGPDSGP